MFIVNDAVIEEIVIFMMSKTEKCTGETPILPDSENSTVCQRISAAILILACSFIFNFLRDVPGSLENVIENEFSIPTYKYEYLYTSYGIAAIFMCFFAGLLIDRVFGLYRGSVLSVSVAVLGQLIITVGGFIHCFWLMILGRFILGIGSESFGVSINCYIVYWFKGKEINVMFGSLLSVNRIGSMCAFIVGTPLYQFLKRKQSTDSHNLFGITLIPFLVLVIIQLILVIILAIISSRKNKKTDAKEESKSSLIYLMKFPLRFFLVAIIFSFSTTTLFSFLSTAQELFEIKYHLNILSANNYSKMLNLFTAIFGPLVGFAVHKLGRELTFAAAALLCGILAQIIFSLTCWSPYIPVILFCLCVSGTVTCSWPLVALVVEKYQLATAYGVLQSIMNTVLSVYVYSVGLLLDKYGPLGIFLLYICSHILSLGSCCELIILDKISNGILNVSPTVRKNRL